MARMSSGMWTSVYVSSWARFLILRREMIRVRGAAGKEEDAGRSCALGPLLARRCPPQNQPVLQVNTPYQAWLMIRELVQAG